MRFNRLFLLLTACWILPTLGAPQMTLSANQIAYGNRLEITFADDKPIQNLPDLSVLQKDFVIRGQQQSANTRIINGIRTEQHHLTLSLFPKQKGSFTIGPFVYNGVTLPAQTVEVTDAPATPPAVTGQNPSAIDTPQPSMPPLSGIFIPQATISPTTIYEGESTLYTVKLTENVGLTQADIQTPTSPEYTLVPFGEDKLTRDTIDNQPVRVYERAFLLTPEKSGQITVQPAGVLGFTPDRSSRLAQKTGFFGTPFDNGAFFDMAFGLPQKEIYHQTEALTLTVKNKPADWTGWWLPSRNVELSENYTLPQTVMVGQPIERHVRLKAQGVEGHKLPLLTQPVGNQIKSYANPDKRSNLISDQGLFGYEEITFVLVPVQSGEILIPEIQVAWFNTGTGQRQIAKLPAQKLRVYASDDTVNTAAATQTPTQPTPPSNAGTPRQQTTAPTETQPAMNDIQPPATDIARKLQWIASAAAGFCLAMLILLIAYKQKKKNPTPPIKPHKKSLYVLTSKQATKSKQHRRKKKPLPDLYPF